MAKPELGTKRLCANCSAKFYDLNKSPIVCPKCNAVLEIASYAQRGRPDAATGARAAGPIPEDVLVPETQDAEFVSLEEADAEAEGAKVGDVIEGTDDDIELDETLDDASLIEEPEETDDDVTDIIGDREDEEES